MKAVLKPGYQFDQLLVLGNFIISHYFANSSLKFLILKNSISSLKNITREVLKALGYL